MTARRIRRDLQELIEAAQLLLAQRLDYEDALQRHFERLLARSPTDAPSLWSLDGVHARFI